METKRSSLLCHDLKTDRLDIGKPLPTIMRLLPLCCYLGLFAGITLSAWFGWQIRMGQQAQTEAAAEKAMLDSDATKVDTEMAGITEEEKKARDVVAWVDTSRPVQQMIVDVLRAVRQGTTISSMSLQRSPEDPRKLLFHASLWGVTPGQTDVLQEQFVAHGYRVYDPNENRLQGGNTEFNCTLLRPETASK
jgi:hypothetical protein